MGTQASVPQATLANSNEVLERSILRTQQVEDAAEHERDGVPGNGDGSPCPGGCGRVVRCVASVALADAMLTACLYGK